MACSSVLRTESSIASSFDRASPDDHYVLDLTVPAERAVALQLSQIDQESSHNLMKNIKLDNVSIESVKKACWPDRYISTHSSADAGGMLSAQLFGA